MWETADAVTTQREKKSLYIFLWICPQVWRGHLDGGNQKPLILVAAFGGSTTVRRSVKMSIIVWPALSFWFLSWFAFDYNQKLFGATATEWESSDLAPVFHEITGIMAIIASSSFSSSQKLGKVWARTDGWSGEWKTTISSNLYNKTQNHVSKTSNHVLKVKKRLAFSHHEIIMDENWRKIGFHLIFEIQTDKSLKISD